MRQARQFVLIAVGWIVVVAALSVLLATLDNVALRDALRRWQFWFLEATFTLCVVLAAATLPGYVRSLALSRADYLSLAAAVALAGLLAGVVAPRTNRIYYDEQIYQNIGQNLADLRLAQMCNEGTVEYGTLQCWRGEYNKQPNGYPYLLSLVYRAAGTSYWAAARFNVLCAMLLVASIFLIASGLFDDRWAARLAALIAALIPQQLLWSHTGAAEPSAALLGSVAVLAAVSVGRIGNSAALGWVVASTVFAAQFRPESLLIVVVVAAVLALLAPSQFRQPRFWAWSLVGLILAAPLVAHMAAVRNEGWGTTGDRLSLDYVVQNIQVNARFYLADSRFPALYTALALGAVAAARQGRAIVVCGLYFFVFWGVYLAFYAGSYNYGADVRYSLMTYPPLALLAGLGGSELMRFWRRRERMAQWIPVLVIAALALQFSWYLPLVRAIGEEAWGARADVAFAEQFVAGLPRNSFVLTHNPGVFHVQGVNAGQMSLLTSEPQYVTGTLLPRYSGGVYLHWNFWCNVDDRLQQEFCQSALGRLPHALVREYRERNYRYALYKLSPPRPAAPSQP